MLLMSRVPVLSILYMVWSFFILIPAIAVGVRRMHDTGRSGWYLFIPVYSIVLLCTAGTVGENAYGPDPKADNEQWDFDRRQSVE